MAWMPKVGDRVRVKPGYADRYVQPWRGRFQKGRLGTVLAVPGPTVLGFLVEFDSRNAKYPDEWLFVMGSCELEPAPRAMDEGK